MKWISWLWLALLLPGLVVAEESSNKDHSTYSPQLLKRSKDDKESTKDYVGYADENNFSDFDQEKSNTYRMSVSPPEGEFAGDSSCSGEVTKDEKDEVTGEKLYLKGTIPGATYIISMSGQLALSGETGPLATWDAYVRNKYFWLTPKEQIVREGTTVSVTAHGDGSEKATWNISASGLPGVTLPNGEWKSGKDKKESNSITLGKALWSDYNIVVPGEEKTPSAGVYDITASVESPVRSAEVKVYVVGIKLKAVEFSGTGNHTLYKTGTDSWTDDRYDDSGDTTIDYAEWQDANGDGTPEVSEPVCYTKGSKPSMKAVMSVVGLPAGTTSAKLRVKCGNDEYATKELSMTGSSVEIKDLVWKTALPDKVDNKDYTLSWEVSLDGGSSYFGIGSSTNKFFVTYGTPAGTPVTAKRLNWSTSKAAGKADAEACSDEIWNAVAEEAHFAYGGITDSWALLDGGVGDCGKLARCMSHTLQMLGIKSEVEFVRASTDSGAGKCLDYEKKTIDGLEYSLIMDFARDISNPAWNLYEGCSVFENYYAIEPKAKESNDYSMLRKLNPDQYWCNIVTREDGMWRITDVLLPKVPIP